MHNRDARFKEREQNCEPRAKQIARCTRTLTRRARTRVDLSLTGRGEEGASNCAILTSRTEICAARFVLHPNPPPMLEEGIWTGRSGMNGGHDGPPHWIKNAEQERNFLH